VQSDLALKRDGLLVDRTGRGDIDQLVSTVCGARATKRTGGPGTGHSIWRATVLSSTFRIAQAGRAIRSRGGNKRRREHTVEGGRALEASILQKTCWSTIRSADDSRVRRVCSREEFARVWASGSGGIAPALR
jgi:hypothetical protein